MRGVDGERGQHGEDLLPEDRAQVVQASRLQLGGGDDHDAALGQPGTDVGAEEARRLAQQAVDPLPDRLQLLRGGHAVGRGGGEPGQHLLPQPGDSNLEELVEGLPQDRQKAHPFQQGQPPICGQGQDPPLELELRELAVQIARPGGCLDGRSLDLDARLGHLSEVSSGCSC